MPTKDVVQLVDRIRPILAGKDPNIVGAALADLLALWLAGHIDPADKKASDDMRAELLTHHVEAVVGLTRVNARLMGLPW